ncbi:MAG: EAL domain-containing protein [Oscillospiraceae bacterium]|nr:EAL domain-containing protein [Oscillospiraceae bacterium]
MCSTSEYIDYSPADNDNAASVASYCRFLDDASGIVEKGGFTVAVFSVNKFAHFCEIYGPSEGRLIKQTIEKTMTAAIGENELFSPYEIHKFVALLQGDDITVSERLKSIFDEICAILASDKCHISASLSCGLCASSGGMGINEIINRADMARRSIDTDSFITQFVVYSDSIRAMDERKKLIELGLANAVKNNELVIDIQPKYDLKTGKCVSAEALVRWDHPKLGRICPDEFILIAEQTGDVIDIDMFVLETVCKHMRRWLDMGVNPVPIAVNQSRMHISDPNYADSIFKMMQKYDVWPSMIELETTESVIMNDYKKVSRVLEQLRNFGFVLSMDDFGSGFTSIDMLSELEYDVLKLDQKLIRKIADYPRSYSLVKHLIAMAHEMNMKVVAEGVETASQAELLKGIDCDLVQGFYYSYPVSVESFDAKIFGIITI